MDGFDLHFPLWNKEEGRATLTSDKHMASSSSSPAPLQTTMLLGSPSFPNAIAWSQDNLLAVATAHFVTILRPDMPHGPRGIIKISPIEPFLFGFVERKDLISGCLLPISLYRDDKPVVQSISWSPLGISLNSGCLLAVCTSEGHVKVYRPPFCDFCSEWIEVVNVSERLFEYLQCTEFQGTGTPLEFSKRNASDEIDSVAKPKKKSLKTVPENDMLPVISADQYATRSAVLSSIVVSWSPLLHDIHATVSLLAVGGKSGKISLWRFYAPDCYTIEGGKIPSAVKFVGFLEAHNSWVTTISWLSFSVNSSNPQILLVTGSSDGSVKVWLGDYHKLIKSTEVDQNVFILLKEVITVNVVPVSVLSVTVHVQCSSKMLLAIGKGSGSFEIWLCDISSKEFNKLGSYDAHDYIVTGLAWAFGGRCLYSCSQDNLVRSWILRDRCLDEVPVHMPHNNNSSSASDDVYDSCLGAAVSPGNLVVATVHCFDVEKLNRMYEGRVLRAAIEYHWIGGLHVDICLNRPVPFYTEELSGLAEKDLTNWGSNIIWSLNQYQCLDRPLVLLDIILALLDFKVSMPRYVEHLLIKWISLSFPGFHTDLPNEKTLLQVSSSLSGVPSRMLHLLNIICRRVMLAQLDADEITRISSEVQNTKGECCSMDEQVTKWIAILGSSERELRERLVGFSFCASQTSKSRPGATPFQTGHWYPVGLAQMEQWIALNNDHVRGELKSIASEVTNEKRCSAVESCSYCSASVPFESPEFGLCQGKTSGSGSNDKRHKLSRCAVSMQVCPSIPLWFCVCCHRVAFRLAPDPLFRMSSSQFDSDFVTKSLSRAVSSKPLCPYCGILLQRRQPDFLVSPLPV
ncbi:hypothetical protein HN51_022326 [Arachis hypogaea]|uniref:Uncharacterized protein LOC107483749 isoform X1 n=1 Tax=Arachis duranensis TaxID=130453 RepID=A0A6P5NEH9_ARADU|nr:uncharacterized protein LOC107483749 isoform X1 [Arachis duranensis]XP_025650700.1 uncharacterized protein LOC112746013 isoform X2 [Arachis hypogaea]XP_052117179.1 uncharacterized protein LOC107483749 isoform X1 [Arachis duranensis]XP_052117180.1 uncharacterized protein LOC107483749 isoform X1 [Arachis duranensis]XP_052117181.1 uncharacterized protein LOC107483749 isoform X1 [Arachis duranensis]